MLYIVTSQIRFALFNTNVSLLQGIIFDELDFEVSSWLHKARKDSCFVRWSDGIRMYITTIPQSWLLSQSPEVMSVEPLEDTAPKFSPLSWATLRKIRNFGRTRALSYKVFKHFGKFSASARTTWNIITFWNIFERIWVFSFRTMLP